MARFADRIAYRLAGLVWTAVYSGLCSRSTGRTIATDAPAERDSAARVLPPAIAA